MPAFYQNAIVMALVAGAALYLALYVYRWLMRKTSGGCGGCHGGCDVAGAKQTPLVVLEMKPPKV